VRNPSRHYRTFSIRKSGGGKRPIESPRTFLKVIQWLLLDFLFADRLKLAETAHAFRAGRSVVTNAQSHRGFNFVGNVDIAEFFNSISFDHVRTLLIQSAFSANEASLMAVLCTKAGHLPQGAPTSPLISNALLFELDERFSAHSRELRCNYTRYADDITISGPSHEAVTSLIEGVSGFLIGRYNLMLNPHKTRIASSHGRQMVTGAVVNTKVQPPRNYRRQVRAIFCNAQRNPREFFDRISELLGYIGYLSQYPALLEDPSLTRYRQIVDQIRSVRPASVPKKSRRR
jgi:retron-type reverse transcriptase